jgi:hypothetical protein
MSSDESLEAILRAIREQRPEAGPAGDAQAASNLQNLSDRTVLQLYDSIRQQVAADRAAGSTYRLVGEPAKQRAAVLKAELVRRGVPFDPIVWP